MTRPRIGLVVLYVPFYEKIVALRSEKEAFASALERELAGVAEVLTPGLIETEESARRAASLLGNQKLDAIVVAPSLAVFGALGWTVLEPLDLPVVLWNVQPADGLPEPYDIGQLIRNSGALGTQALANTLARAGREYQTIFSTGREGVPERLIHYLRAASVAADLRHARFGCIGSVFPQMTDVLLDEEEWTRSTGSTVVRMASSSFTELYSRQRPAAVAERVQEMAADHAILNLSGDELSRSARLSLALDEAVEQLQLDGGAFNCHGENCLQNPEIGVTACFAVSRQTSLGRPFSCTGDLPTAIALFILKRLSGSAVYGELDLVDRSSNAVVIANGGEGDFTAANGKVELVPNENFAGVHGRGASPVMGMSSGPATLLSFTPVSGSYRYRFVIGVGDVVDLPVAELRVFHQAFRFRDLDAGAAFERWCDAGAVHHLALAPGEWAQELALIARLMKFESKQVGGTHAAER